MLSGKWKLKQHWETTTHLLKWLKSNTDSTKCWQGCGATGTLGHGWWGCKLVQPLRKTVSHKTKHILPIWSSNHTPWYLPKGDENLCPNKILNMDVYSSFIHTCPNLEATKMSLSRWMEWINKLWSIREWNIFSELKRNELSSHEKTWWKLKCILLSEGSQSEKATFCMTLSDILEKAKLCRQ